MTTVQAAQDQQQRILNLTYDMATQPQIQALAQASGLPVRRCAGLFAIASVVGAQSAECALRSAESAARWARGNPVAAMRHLHRDLPVTTGRPRPTFGTGDVIRVTLQTWQPSRSMLSGPPRVMHGVAVGDVDRRERVASWTVDPTARVYWRHQRDRHNPDLGTVGRILAAEADPITRDLRVWVQLTDADLVEASLYRELSASPGLAADSPMDRGWSVAQQEHTRTWRQAHVVELSLVECGRQALGGVAVELSPGPPASASSPTTPRIEPWDEPRSARSDRQMVSPTTRTESGQLIQWRTWPHLAPLH